MYAGGGSGDAGKSAVLTGARGMTSLLLPRESREKREKRELLVEGVEAEFLSAGEFR